LARIPYGLDALIEQGETGEVAEVVLIDGAVFGVNIAWDAFHPGLMPWANCTLLADDTLALIGPERVRVMQHKTPCRAWMRPLATLAGVFFLGWFCGDGVQDLGIGQATATVEYHGSRLLKDIIQVGEPLPVTFQLVPHANCQGTSRRYWLYDNGEVAETETYQ